MNNFKEIIETGKQQNTYEQWFSDIAQELLLRSHIFSKGIRYRIKEIEFYYFDETHQDKTAYGFMAPKFKEDFLRIHRHKLKQCETFSWFIHYSGIDIVFGKKDNPGGILIRTIERMEENKKPELIKGPLVVMLELLNQSLNIFENNGFELKLVEANETIDKMVKTDKRVGLGESEFKDALYNFSVE